MRAPISTTTRPWLTDGHAVLGLALGDDEGKLSAPPDHAGPYRLIEKIGEGGLGEVWRAEQSEPVRRTVAVKLIKPGLQTRGEVLARFDLERQALARMTHPNIAAMMDAGTLGDGRPWFVMELVPGEPLTHWCWKRKLSLRQRLELFSTVCLAVHHAHQKGILHRDLKPSNILVTELNGQPVPKIIDFGIAKALDPEDIDLHDPFFATKLGDLPTATYPYMSPEQAAGDAKAVDTRSDIYTLGVILYELLTGELTLPDDLTSSARFDEVARHVCEVDPPRPSERARSGNERACAPHELRGELDWIIQRALEKNPGRRYDSAAALAEDLRRFLADEPVSAGPPSALYQATKWVKRHRVAFATASAVALSVCLGFAATFAALLREKAALAREAEQRQCADVARNDAQAREREAIAAKEQEAKARQSAEQSRNEAVSAKQVADSARGRAEQIINDMLFDLRDQLEPIGRVALLEQVSRSAEGYFGSVPPSSDSDAQQRNRAVMHQNRGHILLAKGDAKGALESFLQSLAIMRDRARGQPNNVQHLHDLALAHESVGTALEGLGDPAKARESYIEMLRVFDHLEGSTGSKPQPWRQDVAIAHERLGELARSQADWQTAETHFRQGHAVLSSLGKNKVILRRLAVMEEKLGAVAEAKRDAVTAANHYQRELELLGVLLKSDNNDRNLQATEATAHGRMAALHSRDAKEASSALVHAVKQEKVFARLVLQDPLHVSWQRSHAIALQQLGVAHELNAQANEAEAAYRNALEIVGRLQTAAPQMQGINREKAAIHLRLASLIAKQERKDEACVQARMALDALAALPASQEVTEWKRAAEVLMR